jgi:RNA polymerase sigma factor (sigma-70 family)
LKLFASRGRANVEGNRISVRAQALSILQGVTTPSASSADKSDEELARAYCEGDASSFEELVRRYMKPMFNFAYRMLGSYSDADDVAQDTFVQVFKSLPTARLDLPFKPWLYVIGRNKCLDFLKRRRPVSFSALDDPDGSGSVVDAIADREPLPDEMLEHADLQRILREAIGRLPERYRTVVSLRYGADLTFAEIAEALSLPENTVKTHFQRAKAVLRADLAHTL